MYEENVKKQIITQTKSFPHVPNWPSKAYKLSAIPSSPCFQAEVTKTEKPVIVHIKQSAMTSVTEYNPAFTGCSTMAFAYMAADVPCPASLEKMPLEKPIDIDIIIEAPVNPPSIGLG